MKGAAARLPLPNDCPSILDSCGDRKRRARRIDGHKRAIRLPLFRPIDKAAYVLTQVVNRPWNGVHRARRVKCLERVVQYARPRRRAHGHVLGKTRAGKVAATEFVEVSMTEIVPPPKLAVYAFPP